MIYFRRYSPKPIAFTLGWVGRKTGLGFLDNPWLDGDNYTAEGRLWVDGYVEALLQERGP